MDYQEAKIIANTLYEACISTGRELTKICNSKPKGLMGLTSPEVHVSQEFIEANIAYELAAQKSRIFNKIYLKRFKKEISAERAVRYTNNSVAVA